MLFVRMACFSLKVWSLTRKKINATRAPPHSTITCTSAFWRELYALTHCSETIICEETSGSGVAILQVVKGRKLNMLFL